MEINTSVTETLNQTNPIVEQLKRSQNLVDSDVMDNLTLTRKAEVLNNHKQLTERYPVIHRYLNSGLNKIENQIYTTTDSIDCYFLKFEAYINFLQDIGFQSDVTVRRGLESLSVEGLNKDGQLEFTMKVAHDMYSQGGKQKGTVTKIFTIPASKIDFDALAELLTQEATSPFLPPN